MSIASPTSLSSCVDVSAGQAYVLAERIANHGGMFEGVYISQQERKSELEFGVNLWSWILAQHILICEMFHKAESALVFLTFSSKTNNSQLRASNASNLSMAH